MCFTTGTQTILDPAIGADNSFSQTGNVSLQTHKLGIADVGEGIFSRTMNKREYELTDHLGNVLTVVSDRKIFTSSSPAYALTGINQDFNNGGIPSWSPPGSSSVSISNNRMQITKSKYYHPNGKLKSIIYYKNNLRDSVSKFFDEKGNLNKVGYFVNDTLEGEIMYYFSSGKIKTIGTMVKGEMKEYKTLDEDGVVVDASPYITVTSIKDTIEIGELFTSTIKLNFPPKGQNCKIAIRRDSDTTLYDALPVNNCEAQLMVTPKSIGFKNINGVVIVLNNNDEGIIKQYFNKKFWVKGK